MTARSRWRAMRVLPEPRLGLTVSAAESAVRVGRFASFRATYEIYGFSNHTLSASGFPADLRCVRFLRHPGDRGGVVGGGALPALQRAGLGGGSDTRRGLCRGVADHRGDALCCGGRPDRAGSGPDAGDDRRPGWEPASRSEGRSSVHGISGGDPPCQDLSHRLPPERSAPVRHRGRIRMPRNWIMRGAQHKSPSAVSPWCNQIAHTRIQVWRNT